MMLKTNLFLIDIRRRNLFVVRFLPLLFCMVLSHNAFAFPEIFGRDFGNYLFDWPFNDVSIKKLVRGAPIHGANGLAIDSNNRLYVASALGQEIVIMNSHSGRILDRLRSENGVTAPDDLVFASDGSLYWTDLLSGEVGLRAPDGTVKKQFVAPFINPIAFSNDGRLFVAQAFIDDGLYEIDPKLERPPVQILHTGIPDNSLNGFDFGPDGLLYAPRQRLNQMVRINVDTGAVEVLTDQFSGACKFDSSGRLHVAADDPGLLRFDPDTKEVTLIAELPKGSDNLTFDAYGRIYVSNFLDGSIYRVYPNGRFRQISRGGLIAPAGITVLPDEKRGETLFVADFWSMRAFDARSGRPGSVGSDFFFEAPFGDSPFTVAADGNNLILTSAFGNTLEVWNPKTRSVVELYEGYDTPLNAIRFQGDFIVAELGTGSLIRQDGQTGERTVLTDKLMVPTGLAATENDLWAADWATGTLWQIVANNEILNPAIPVAYGLANPEGLALDDNGDLLVVEASAGRLSRVDSDTGMVSTIVDGLSLGAKGVPGWPPTWLFNGVTVGRRGDIYVTGDIDNSVYQIKTRK